MIIVIPRVKIEDVSEGANRKLDNEWYGKFSHVEEQGYAIVHACNVYDMWKKLSHDVPS